MYYQERQEAIEFLYAMLEGHQHHFALELVNQINDNTTPTEIHKLAMKAYDTPIPGLKAITTPISERYIQRFGGFLTGCFNDPMSYPKLINPLGDEIGIIME